MEYSSSDQLQVPVLTAKWKAPERPWYDRVTFRLGCESLLRLAAQPGGIVAHHPRQCGCQASSDWVRAATDFGSVPSASERMLTCSKTSRRLLRAAIQTCWRTSADAL